jgi:hypothetical protein
VPAVKLTAALSEQVTCKAQRSWNVRRVNIHRRHLAGSSDDDILAEGRKHRLLFAMLLGNGPRRAPGG